MTSKFRALVIDIETAPGVAYVFNAHKPFIQPEHIIKDTAIICVATCWSDSNHVELFADWTCGHKRMLQEVYNRIEEADAVIHYNGVSFDMPHLRFEFFKAKFPPLARKPQIDLLQTINREFRALSHRLKFMGPALEVGNKMAHEGFALWRSVIEGDKKARVRMGKYCCEDVRVEKRMYHRLRPLMGAQHPNVSLWETECGDRPLCTVCGSSRLENRGLRRASTYTYRRFRCRDCKGYSKERLSLKAAAKPLTIGV